MRAATRLVAVLAASGLALAACGSDDADTAADPTTDPTTSVSPSATEEPPASDISVGLAYDVGGRGDRSFNDAAALGLDMAAEEFGIETEEVSPNASGSDRGDNLRALAEDGFDVVIAVGFAYAEDLGEIAPDFPDTTFFIVDDESLADQENVKSLVFAEEQGSFLVGAAAALTTETNNVGFIGGVQTELLEKFEAGFAAGVAQIDPAIEVQSTYLSQPPDFTGFGDPQAGMEAANGFFDAGADVIYAAAGGSGLGVFQSALANDALGIGVDSDQYLSIGEPTLQPVILTSMLKRVDTAVFLGIEAFVNGEEIEPVTRFDLSNEGVDYATSGGFVDDIAAQLDELKQMIIDGDIVVPTVP